MASFPQIILPDFANKTKKVQLKYVLHLDKDEVKPPFNMKIELI